MEPSTPRRHSIPLCMCGKPRAANRSSRGYKIRCWSCESEVKDARCRAATKRKRAALTTSLNKTAE